MIEWEHPILFYFFQKEGYLWLFQRIHVRAHSSWISDIRSNLLFPPCIRNTFRLLPLETGYFSSAALCSKQCDSPQKWGWGVKRERRDKTSSRNSSIFLFSMRSAKNSIIFLFILIVAACCLHKSIVTEQALLCNM